MKNLILSCLALSLLLFIWHCTPKTTEATKSTDNIIKKPATSDDPCAKFSDSRAGESALDAHVIYRDYIRSKKYKEALPYWRQAFKAAPAADGKRKTHFTDGIELYTDMMEDAPNEAIRAAYLDSIDYMYDRMALCFEEEPGYLEGRKAWDQYYKFRDDTPNSEIFANFKTAYDETGLDAPAFIINPFTALLVEMYQNKEIEKEVAVKYAKQILAVTEKNENSKEDGWPIVLNYAPARLEIFEVEKGFYDCNYYLDKYYADFEAASTDCDVIETVLSRLKWGDCGEGSPEIASLRAAYNTHCRVATASSGPLRTAKDALESGNYQEAVNAYLSYVESQDDAEKKAKYLLRIAKIYYAHLKSFSKARDYARKALQQQANLGDAYLLIGKLYASSGPLCGPGRGWDSQIVTWPAIDKFQQAKKVDSSVASQANKLIATYQQYMPSKEDIFQRQMSEGQSFTVPCWIQENTKVRAAK